MQHIILLEDASLELLPEELQREPICKKLQQQFGIPPEKQILDDNYHGPIMKGLEQLSKRGRPDVVHFALLDIVSTPLYLENQVSVKIHTISDTTITLRESVRLPRTLNRFCGVMSKILSGDLGEKERDLFEFQQSKSFEELISEIQPAKVIGFSSIGESIRMETIVRSIGEATNTERTVWVIGGFAFGHFDQAVVEKLDRTVSISKHSLAAHVVTARLCYEIERTLGIWSMNSQS